VLIPRKRPSQINGCSGTKFLVYCVQPFGFMMEAHEMAEALTVERSVWINAPRERVWQAITDAEQIQQWWGDYWDIPTLEVGATIKFGNPCVLSMATFNVLDPPPQFTLHWPSQPQYHSSPIRTIFVSAEENAGTRVTVTEAGFEARPDDVRQTRFAQTAQGY